MEKRLNKSGLDCNLKESYFGICDILYQSPHIQNWVRRRRADSLAQSFKGRRSGSQVHTRFLASYYKREKNVPHETQCCTETRISWALINDNMWIKKNQSTNHNRERVYQKEKNSRECRQTNLIQDLSAGFGGWHLISGVNVRSQRRPDILIYF